MHPPHMADLTANESAEPTKRPPLRKQIISEPARPRSEGGTASGAADRLGIEVGVEKVSLNAESMVRYEDMLRGRPVKVELSMPKGISKSTLASKGVPLAEGKALINYRTSVDLPPGSTGHVALLDAIRKADETSKAKAETSGSETEAEEESRLNDADCEILFTLVAMGASAGTYKRSK